MVICMRNLKKGYNNYLLKMMNLTRTDDQVITIGESTVFKYKETINTCTPRLINVYTCVYSEYILLEYLLVCELVRHHKQVDPGQACPCAQVGYLHPFIRVPV